MITILTSTKKNCLLYIESSKSLFFSNRTTVPINKHNQIITTTIKLSLKEDIDLYLRI